MNDDTSSLYELPYHPGTDIFLPSTDSDDVASVRVRVAEGALASLPWEVIAEPWWLEATKKGKELVLRPLNCGRLVGTVRTAANGVSDRIAVRSDVIASREAKRAAVVRATAALVGGAAVTLGLLWLAERFHLHALAVVGVFVPGAIWGAAINGPQLVTRGSIAVAAGGFAAAFLALATSLAAAAIFALIRSAAVLHGHFEPASPIAYLALSPLGVWAGSFVGAQAWGSLLSPGWLASVAQRRAPSMATATMGVLLFGLSTQMSVGGSLAWLTYPHTVWLIGMVAVASFLGTVASVSAEIAPIKRTTG
jgi:hypothetical protein